MIYLMANDAIWYNTRAMNSAIIPKAFDILRQAEVVLAEMQCTSKLSGYDHSLSEDAEMFQSTSMTSRLSMVLDAFLLPVYMHI